MSDVDMFESQKGYSKKHEHFEDSDVIPGTPMTAKKKKKKKRHKKKIKWKEKIVIDHEDFEDQIQMTEMGSFDNKPFVFHKIEEALRYTLERFPKNNNMQLIGVHRFCSRKGHYLQKHLGEVVIPLDFTVAGKIPDENETLSVFGFIEFRNSMTIFVVKFFRKELKIVLNKYIHNLLEVRKYVPIDYLTTVSNNTFK